MDPVLVRAPWWLINCRTCNSAAGEFCVYGTSKNLRVAQWPHKRRLDDFLDIFGVDPDDWF